MATIKKRTGKDGKVSFHVRIRLKGQPLECATFPNITKAKAFIQQTEASIKEGRYFKDVEAKKHSLGDLIDRYIQDELPKKPKSFEKQRKQLLWWKGQLGHCLLFDLVRSPARIIEKRDFLARGVTGAGTVRSPATVVRYLAALSHAFTIAMKEWSWVDDNPMRKVSKPKEPRGRVRFLDDEERGRLLQACKNSAHSFLYIIVILALSTGMRFSEIMNLEWKFVDFENNKIILEETKNGDRRQVPLVGHAFDLLEDLWKRRRLDSFLIFPCRRTPFKPIGVRSAWEKVLIESGVEDFRFHDLRHSFASEMAMGKATDTELRILLGHKSPSMTARYSHLTEKHTSEIVKKMTSKIFPPETSSAVVEQT